MPDLSTQQINKVRTSFDTVVEKLYPQIDRLQQSWQTLHSSGAVSGDQQAYNATQEMDKAISEIRNQVQKLESVRDEVFNR